MNVCACVRACVRACVNVCVCVCSMELGLHLARENVLVQYARQTIVFILKVLEAFYLSRLLQPSVRQVSPTMIPFFWVCDHQSIDRRLCSVWGAREATVEICQQPVQCADPNDCALNRVVASFLLLLLLL